MLLHQDPGLEDSRVECSLLQLSKSETFRTFLGLSVLVQSQDDAMAEAVLPPGSSPLMNNT